MRAEINHNGKFVIKDITQRALDYIAGCPAKEYFVQEKDTVYVNQPFAKSKEDLMSAIKQLSILYRMELSPAVGYVLNCWNSEEMRTSTAERQLACKDENAKWGRKELNDLQHKAELLGKYKRLILQGCKGCDCFRISQFGDDCQGYCCAKETAIRLNESPLSFEYGEIKNGVRYMGQIYYPHKQCKYLQEDRI